MIFKGFDFLVKMDFGPKVFVEPESEPNRSESDHQRGIIESFNHATQTSNLVRSPPNGIYYGTINRGANWLRSHTQTMPGWLRNPVWFRLTGFKFFDFN